MLGSFLQIPIDPDLVAKVDSTTSTVKEATGAMIATIKEDPNAALQTMGQDALHLLLKVLIAVVIYIVGAWLIKKISKALHKSMERRKTDRAIVTFTTSLVSITLTVLLIVVVIGTLGINTTSLAAVLAAGGMAIGLALSGTVQNVAGGLMIIAFKPFRAGDLIEAQGYLGTVTEVSIVATKLHTPDNRVITLPNGALSSGTINNYSPRPARRIDIDLPFEHGTDLDMLRATLLTIVSKDERILKEPFEGEGSAPTILVCDIDKDAVTVRTRFWCKNADYWPLYFGMRETIYTSLGKAGFKIAANRVDVKQS